MIELTEKAMKTLDMEFRTRASRLYQAKYQEVLNLLEKFIGYVDRTPTLAEYVQSCDPELSDAELNEMISAVAGGWGEVTFDFGNSTQEEVARSYRVMKSVLSKHDVHFLFAIGRAYDGDSQFQSSTEGFVHGVVTPFVDGINLYLHTIAMNARIGDTRTITINNNGSNAQINISDNGATLSAQQHNEVGAVTDFESLKQYLLQFNIPIEDVQELKDILSREKPESKEHLGKSTNQWIAKVVNKVAEGAVSLPFATASSILATLICKSVGLG